MGFSSQRGRPKQPAQEEYDLGTPELQAQRKAGKTVEPLDWLRQRELISPKQHWCGLHFRWLFTLRYGAVTLQSLDAAKQQGIVHQRDYTLWQMEREREWNEALTHLEHRKLLNVALTFCVYKQNIPPQWRHSTRGLEYLSAALHELEILWCKPRKTVTQSSRNR